MKSGVQHEENFPVASWLCPPHLRPVIASIYWFARTADDLADEGTASATQRLQDLNSYREALDRAAQTPPLPCTDPRWATTFATLAVHLHAHALPLQPLQDLLSAFEQDVRRTDSGQRYANMNELLAYCRWSANPVGRLLMHLYGVSDEAALRASDGICTALQLINFWQDLSVDLPRHRHYLPQDRLTAHGLHETDFAASAAGNRTATDPRCLLLAELVSHAEALMLNNAHVALRLPGRAGWELRLVVQGGLRVAELIRRDGFQSWQQRPKLRAIDLPRLVWRAWRMA